MQRDALTRPIDEAVPVGGPREHVPLVEQRSAVVLHDELLGELSLHGNLRHAHGVREDTREISIDGMYPVKQLTL